MQKSDLSPEVLEKVQLLAEKYEAMGQDLSSYLEGLLYSDYLKYWDYIRLDSLLDLQHPKTEFPDEVIFIMYHQITELYLKLALWELKQLSENEELTAVTFGDKILRVVRYLENLVRSFDVMVDGMEPQQFHKFRMALLPSSGFQSAQFRFLELHCTDMVNLVAPDLRQDITGEETTEMLYDMLYWRRGATELATGNKTLTLKHFERKYSDRMLQMGEKLRSCNIHQLYVKHFANTPQAEELVPLLRRLDMLANVDWCLAHYKSAVRYLHRDPIDIAATGGTNWQKYLPPRFQQIIFFPELWTEEERKNWGKTWVMREVFHETNSEPISE
ncbi:MAG TPA: tryptophan 2,3-dioxygenase [Cytophagales bacterium]|nr:tryptophan 2,3-dioxygenase [Cytophagales bacterium]HAA20246.1 tryptophan 2,3-dioxygenase [Cytophagales bacterium]HAP61780.1 tryptophan 2,3-dioxygenase [Cytophagales bacterium]